MSHDPRRTQWRAASGGRLSTARAVAVVACATGAGLAAGWGAAAIALVASLPLIRRRAHPRFLLSAAAALAALVPLAWGVGNAGRVGEVSARLVTENPLPGWLAAAAIAVALLGVVLDVVPAVGTDRRPAVEQPAHRAGTRAQTRSTVPAVRPEGSR